MDDVAGEDGKGDLTKVIEASGLPTTFKGRTQRFLLRWLAGSIAHPYVREVRDNLDVLEGRSRVSIMLAEEVGRQAIADPEIIERAKARFLGETARKQDNLEYIAREADALIDEPTSEPVESADVKPEPDPDWMNTFTREAEDASSDELRKRLARLLAGEVCNPGTYSRATIRKVAELDQDVIRFFQEILFNRVADTLIRDEALNSGDNFVRGAQLADAGLISDTSGFTNFQISFNASGHGFLMGSEYSLVLTGSAGLPMKTVGVWLLTRSGKEIASLLNATDERPPLRKAAGLIDKAGLTRIVLGRRFLAAASQIGVTHDEVVWEDTTKP